MLSYMPVVFIDFLNSEKYKTTRHEFNKLIQNQLKLVELVATTLKRKILRLVCIFLNSE